MSDVDRVDAKEDDLAEPVPAATKTSNKVSFTEDITGGQPLKSRSSSKGQLASMYPSTDTGKFKYDSKITDKEETSPMDIPSVVDTVKVCV